MDQGRNIATSLARLRRAACRGAVLLTTLVPLAACDFLDRVLSVDAPSRIPAETLEKPENAQLLLNGAIADFECALGAHIVLGGMIGEELVDATQTADRLPYDRRVVISSDSRYQRNSCDALGVYIPIQTARGSADRLLQLLETWTDAEVPNRTLLIATAAAYSGYAHILLGEAFCSAAISRLLPDGTIEYGPEMTRAEIFALAEAKFTQAIAAAQSVSNNEILNMALVGRARARLNQGNKSGAATDAAAVSLNFVKNATASGGNARRENRVAAQNNVSNSVSIGPLYRAMTTDGVADPRVPTTDLGRNATEGTRLWVQNKYATISSPIPIATWEEAQLIIAENRVATGDLQGAVAIINTLRSRHGLPQYSSSNAADILNTIIAERRRELFLEGHHLFDLVRYSLPFNPPVGAVYPKGGNYGDTKCLPLPDIERFNNPLIGA